VKTTKNSAKGTIMKHGASSGKIQTPLARARGLGSAHHGTGHWIVQRVTAIALIPLVLWLAWSVITLAGADYDTFTAWLAWPLNAVGMILFIIASFYHAALGLQVIIEDYVHCECLKIAKLLAVNLGLFALGAACVFSVLKVAL
jgi:succinate dehydrogenase / fumarate reductase, membrane anchor subunit